MKKKLYSFVLALSMVATGLLTVTNTVKADELTPVAWDVNFDGKELVSSYDFDTTKSTISGAMPGDVITYEVEYKNSSSKAVDYYMSSDVVASLETGSEAAGGAYSYGISYNAGGEDIYLFNSETLGGDNPDVQGLLQAQTGGDNYFYLGQLKAGKSGKVKIQIALDGNSQNNDYMSQIAQLNIKFGVETVATTTRTIVNRLPDGTEIVTIKNPNVVLAGPKTGDSMLPLVLCGIALLVGIALILLYFKRAKEEEVTQ